MNHYIALQLKINRDHQDHLIVSFLLGKTVKKLLLILLFYYFILFLGRLKRRILDSPRKNKIAKQVEF